MRVPASIVVRMNSASNMIAKWYQYFQTTRASPGSGEESARRLVEDIGHADGQRHRAAGAAAEDFLACAASHSAQMVDCRRRSWRIRS